MEKQEDDHLSSDEEFESVPLLRLWKLNMHIPNSMFGLIIGTRGQTKTRIAESTKTEIYIPRRGQDGLIQITSSSKNNILKARRQLLDIVDSAKKRPRKITHFISIPCNDEKIQNRFKDFKETVMKKYGDCRGISDELFQEPAKLHLTIEILALLDDRERKKSGKVLEKTIDQLKLSNGCKPFDIHLKGLEYMNDDPSEVHSLYGKVSPSDTDAFDIQSFADTLKNGFKTSGLVAKLNSNPVKLYMKLMSSRYNLISLFRTTHAGSSSRYRVEKIKGEPKESFDATKLLEEMRDFDFGVVTVSKIHISIISSTDEFGQFYQSLKIVNL